MASQHAPRSRPALWIVFLTALGIGILGAGCESSTGPGAGSGGQGRTLGEDTESRGVVNPLPIPEEEAFLAELWETLFEAPFDLAASDAGLDAQVLAPGSYPGTSSSGEAFDAFVTAVDYYPTQDLLARTSEPDAVATIQQYGLSMSQVITTLITAKGQVEISALVIAGEDAGSPFAQLLPIDYERPLPDPVVDLSMDGASTTTASTLPEWNTLRSGARLAKGDCQSDCEAANGYPAPAPVRCRPGKILNEECLEEARARYAAAMSRAIQEFCEGGCVAVEQYERDVEACREDWLACEIFASIRCILRPWGCTAHLRCLSRLRGCRKQANQDFDATLAQLQAEVQSEYESAWNQLRAESIACCEWPPMEEISEDPGRVR